MTIGPPPMTSAREVAEKIVGNIAGRNLIDAIESALLAEREAAKIEEREAGCAGSIREAGQIMLMDGRKIIGVIVEVPKDALPTLVGMMADETPIRIRSRSSEPSADTREKG